MYQVIGYEGGWVVSSSILQRSSENLNPGLRFWEQTGQMAQRSLAFMAMNFRKPCARKYHAWPDFALSLPCAVSSWSFIPSLPSDHPCSESAQEPHSIGLENHLLKGNPAFSYVASIISMILVLSSRPTHGPLYSLPFSTLSTMRTNASSW